MKVFHLKYNAKLFAIAIVSATAIAILSFFVFRALRPTEYNIEPDRTRFPLIGIDISAHNGTINFKKVKEEGGVSFAFIKATEGADFNDAAFARNYDAANWEGINVGPYHYFRFDSDGKAQAQNLLSTINDREFQLPVAVDVEDWLNSAPLPSDSIVDNLRVFINTLQSKEIPLIIYTNKRGYSKYIRGNFDNLPLWICSFTNPPVSASVQWKIWQHSHVGEIPGIKGMVDLNTFNGDSALFSTFLSRYIIKND